MRPVRFLSADRLKDVHGAGSFCGLNRFAAYHIGQSGILNLKLEIDVAMSR